MRYITNSRMLIGLSLIAVITILVVSIMNRPPLTTLGMRPAPQEEPHKAEPMRPAPQEEPRKAEPSIYAQNTHYNRGVSNMKSGRYDLAIDDFTQVIRV
jgi:TolA-binding protein